MASKIIILSFDNDKTENAYMHKTDSKYVLIFHNIYKKLILIKTTFLYILTITKSISDAFI